METHNIELRTCHPEPDAHARTTVKAIRIAPGLVVHRALEGERGDWSLTHERSGLSLHSRPIHLKATAIKIAKHVAQLADWTQEAEVLREQEGLKASIWDIVTGAKT